MDCRSHTEGHQHLYTITDGMHAETILVGSIYTLDVLLVHGCTYMLRASFGVWQTMSTKVSLPSPPYNV